MPILKDKIRAGKRVRYWHWQHWEIELLNIWKQDDELSNPEIARRFGVPYSSLAWKLNQQGFRKAIDWKAELPDLKAMVAQGRSIQWLAWHYEVYPNCIRTACVRYGVPLPSKRRKSLAREVTQKVA